MSWEAYTRPVLSAETEIQQKARLAASLVEDQQQHAFKVAKRYVNEKLERYEDAHQTVLSQAEITILVLDWSASDGVNKEYREALAKLVATQYALQRSNGSFEA